jgi:hypothetical protein
MWAIHILEISCRTSILVFGAICSCFSRGPNKLCSLTFNIVFHTWHLPRHQIIM